MFLYFLKIFVIKITYTNIIQMYFFLKQIFHSPHIFNYLKILNIVKVQSKWQICASIFNKTCSNIKRGETLVRNGIFRNKIYFVTKLKILIIKKENPKEIYCNIYQDCLLVILNFAYNLNISGILLYRRCNF